MIGGLFLVIEVVLGIGLILNCARGLISSEGMYDAESTMMMTVSQWFGIGVGIALLIHVSEIVLATTSVTAGGCGG